MKFALVSATLATSILKVNAHGWLDSITADGVTYPAWAVYSDPYVTPTPVRVERKVLDAGPVIGFESSNITCNNGGNIPTSAFATATAGSTVTWKWNSWPQGNHSGPVMTYIAKCPNGCSSFKGDSGAVWVKIEQSGYDRSKNPPWGGDQLAAAGSKWTTKIPAGLANGEYILRHEILALHVAGTVGGAQFYPHCVQVKIVGGGSKSLPSGIALPGAYKPTDPGILTQLWWFSSSNTTASYTPPGGPVISV